MNQWVGLLWTSDQLVAETSTWQRRTVTTDRHASRGIRTHNTSKQAEADLRLFRPRGHRDGHLYCLVKEFRLIDVLGVGDFKTSRCCENEWTWWGVLFRNTAARARGTQRSNTATNRWANIRYIASCVNYTISGRKLVLKFLAEMQSRVPNCA
jgi:hypothetical protein